MKKFITLTKNKTLMIGITLYKQANGKVYFVKPYAKIIDKRYSIHSW